MRFAGPLAVLLAGAARAEGTNPVQRLEDALSPPEPVVEASPVALGPVMLDFRGPVPVTRRPYRASVSAKDVPWLADLLVEAAFAISGDLFFLWDEEGAARSADPVPMRYVAHTGGPAPEGFGAYIDPDDEEDFVLVPLDREMLDFLVECQPFLCLVTVWHEAEPTVRAIEPLVAPPIEVAEIGALAVRVAVDMNAILRCLDVTEAAEEDGWMPAPPPEDGAAFLAACGVSAG